MLPEFIEASRSSGGERIHQMPAAEASGTMVTRCGAPLRQGRVILRIWKKMPRMTGRGAASR